MNTAETLLRFKNQEAEAGRQINRIEGELKQLMSSLKKKFGVDTIKRTEGLLKKKRELRKKKVKKLEADVAILEDEYDWD